MKLDFTDILTSIILEQSREEVLLNKFTKPKKKGKKPLMSQEEFYMLVKADPTTRVDAEGEDDKSEVKKVGAYTQWLIKQYMLLQQKADKESNAPYGTPQWNATLDKLQDTFQEDLYKVTEDLQKFHRFKGKISKDKRDINRISSPDELYELTKDFSLEEATTTKAERVLQDAELVYDGPGWEVLIPQSKEASCHYGSGTRWCTAGSTSNYYDHYSKQGPLYIMLNKKDPTDKYQFHFESNQYMDKEDRQVNLPTFLNERPELKEFFKEMFKNFWREKQGDQLSGIYDFEYEGTVEPGRSVLNKINTNATTFCLLKNDMNKVLKYYGHEPISFKGKSESQQIKEVYRFIGYIKSFKSRLFGHASKTLTNMYKTVNRRHKQGDRTEQNSVKLLNKIFGDGNVKQVGGMGSVVDALGGVDAVIRTPEGDKTAQIKPFRYYKEDDGKITMFDTGVIKPYKTDWLVFHNNKKGVMVFDNSNTEIIGGRYVFNKEDLYNT